MLMCNQLRKQHFAYVFAVRNRFMDLFSGSVAEVLGKVVVFFSPTPNPLTVVLRVKTARPNTDFSPLSEFWAFIVLAFPSVKELDFRMGLLKH